MFYFCLPWKYFALHPDLFSPLVFSRTLMIGDHFIKSGAGCFQVLKQIQFWPGSKTVNVGNHLELLECDWQRPSNYFTQIMDNSNFLSQPTSATHEELMQILSWKLKFNLKKYFACIIINLLKYFAFIMHSYYSRRMLHLLLAYVK